MSDLNVASPVDQAIADSTTVSERDNADASPQQEKTTQSVTNGKFTSDTLSVTNNDTSDIPSINGNDNTNGNGNDGLDLVDPLKRVRPKEEEDIQQEVDTVPGPKRIKLAEKDYVSIDNKNGFDINTPPVSGDGLEDVNADKVEASEPSTTGINENSTKQDQTSNENIFDNPDSINNSTPSNDDKKLNDSVLEPKENPTEQLPRHQQRSIVQTIKAVKRLKDAGPFVHPVDIVKLNIPLYPTIVTNPIDLTTMEKKAQDNEYFSPDEVISDFQLLVDNCIKFNGVESQISTMARNIQANFERHMAQIPPRELPPPPIKTKQKAISPLSNGLIRRSARTLTDSTIITVPVSSPTSKGADPSSMSHSQSNSISKTPKVKSERPKREIHPPKRDLTYSKPRPRNSKLVAELKYCNIIIKELTSKKHDSYSFPFLVPVDPVAAEAPNYFDVIKHPMDLGTINNKLTNGEYNTAEEFEDDVRLVFTNCYAFNPEGTPVNEMGKKLEAVFNKKLTEKPVFQDRKTPTIEYEEGGEVDGDSETEDSEDETYETVTNPAIEFLEKQLIRMKSDLLQLKKKQYEQDKKLRRKLHDKKRNSVANGRRKSSKVNSVEIHITYKMKEEISEKIQEVSEDKMERCINIIRQSLHDLDPSEEIELDFDSLDDRTIMKLYKFLKCGDTKVPKGPRKSVADNDNKGKRKSKALTEAEQNSQIKQLQQQIKAFDTAAGTGANSNNPEKSDGDENGNDDSDDDDGDESSSEEE